MKRQVNLLCLCTLFLFSVFSFSRAENPNLLPTLEDGLYGFMDERDIMVIPAIYQEAGLFIDGLALVARDVSQDGWPYEYGFINQSGEEVIPVIYKSLSPFSENLTLAQYQGKYGYLDPEGAVVLDFIYDEASLFLNGQAVVKLEGQTQVIQNPILVQMDLTLDPQDYKLLTTPEACIDYLDLQLSQFSQRELSSHSQSNLSGWMSHFLATLPALEVLVQRDQIYLVEDHYETRKAQGESLYLRLNSLLLKFDLPQEMDDQLALLRQGLGHLTTQGQTVTLSSTTDYQVAEFPAPYLDAEYYQTFTESQEYLDYLQQQLAQMTTEPNASGQQSVEHYVSLLFASMEPWEDVAWFNRIQISSRSQMRHLEEGLALHQQVESLLSAKNITLSQQIPSTLTFLFSGVNLDKSLTLTLEKETLAPFQDLQGLRLIFATTGEGIWIPFQALSENIGQQDKLKLTLDYEENQVQITFTEEEGAEEALQVQAPFFFTLPATQDYASIRASLGLGKDLGTDALVWSGLVHQGHSLEFSTSRSGLYQRVEEPGLLVDDDQLSQTDLPKITALIAKGIFTLDQGNFRGNDNFTRAELATALVGLTSTQDPTAATTFSDVSSDSPQAVHIAAAVQAGLLQGYEDNTFRGEHLPSRSEVLQLLVESFLQPQAYPQDIEELLAQYADGHTIPDSIKPAVAFALSHNLIPVEVNFRGEDPLTREEAALWCYAFFQEAYQQNLPTAQSLEEISSYNWKFSLLCVLITGSILLILLLLFFLKRLEQQQNAIHHLPQHSQPYRQLPATIQHQPPPRNHQTQDPPRDSYR